MINEQSLGDYVVGKFYDRESGTTVDAVPKSWLFVDKTDNNKIKCYYPPKTEWKSVQSWSQELKEPDGSWEAWNIDCRYNTNSFQVADEICDILNNDSDVPSDRQDLLDRVCYQDDDLEDQIRRDFLLRQAEILSSKFREKQSENMKESKTIGGKKQTDQSKTVNDVLNGSDEKQSGNIKESKTASKRKRTEQTTTVNDIQNGSDGELGGSILKKPTTSTGKSKQTKQKISLLKVLNVNLTNESNKCDSPFKSLESVFPQRQNNDKEMVVDLRNTREHLDKDIAHCSTSSVFANYSRQSTKSSDEYDNARELPSKTDITDLRQRVSCLEGKIDHIEEIEIKNRKDIKTMSGNIEKILQSLKNGRVDSSIDCDYLAKKHGITLPVKSRPEFDFLETKLKNKQAYLDIKTFMINSINDSSLTLMAATRIIAKRFLTSDVASKFVIQISQKGKKEIMKETHRKFVNCVINVLMNQLKVTEKEALSKLGNVIVRSIEWGKKKTLMVTIVIKIMKALMEALELQVT